MKLILPRLPGLNEYISAERSNKHAAAGMKRQCEREIRLCIRAQWKGKVRFRRPVAMRYLWVEKNKRRDKDNIAFAKKIYPRFTCQRKGNPKRWLERDRQLER